MLENDPKQRITAKKALLHSFFTVKKGELQESDMQLTEAEKIKQFEEK